MARRRRPERREILPDPRFGDVVLSKFMNSVMLDGQKSIAEGIVYGALASVEARAKKEPIGVFHEALANIRPNIEEIGRASCRARVCQYVWISEVGVTLKNKITSTTDNQKQQAEIH